MYSNTKWHNYLSSKRMTRAQNVRKYGFSSFLCHHKFCVIQHSPSNRFQVSNMKCVQHVSLTTSNELKVIRTHLDQEWLYQYNHTIVAMLIPVDTCCPSKANGYANWLKLDEWTNVWMNEPNIKEKSTVIHNNAHISRNDKNQRTIPIGYENSGRHTACIINNFRKSSIVVHEHPHLCSATATATLSFNFF